MPTNFTHNPTTNHHDAALWSRIMTNPDAKGILRLALSHVARDLSEMVKRPIKVDRLTIEVTSLEELIGVGDNPEVETVGVYLLIGDELPGQAVLMLSLDDAMYLADWLLEQRPGTTTRLESMEYSALAEVGNQTLSSFLNVLAEFTGRPLHLSAPVVTVDMLATLLEVIVTSVAAVTDELVIIKTDFEDIHHSLRIKFWVWPDPDATTEIKNLQKLKA